MRPSIFRGICLFGFAAGLALSASGQAILPYITDFDSSLGFTIGSLNGQQDWLVLAGHANVVTSTTITPPFGSQCVELEPPTAPDTTAPEIGIPFAAPSPTQPVVYVDCILKPVASSSISSYIYLDTSLAVLVRNDGAGGGQIFALDGSLGWVPTPAVFAINNSNSAATDWMHLTFRLDFRAKTWDLYYNGAFVAHDVAFLDDTLTYLPFFMYQGDPTAPSYLNLLYAGPTNLLFTDINNDGIPDSWITGYGLTLTANDRDLDPDGDGLTNLEEYITGTDPTDYYNGVLPVITSQVDSSGVPGASGLVSVKVTQGSTLLANAPVTLTVTSGASVIATTPGGAISSSVTVRTNPFGIATAYVTFGSFASDVLVATAQSGSHSTSIRINIDPPPTYLGNALRVWLKADDPNIVQNTGKVSLWPDNSGINPANNATQGTPSNQPTLVTAQTDPSVPNGRPVVRFNKSNSQSLKLPTNPMSGASQGEIFAVVRSTGFGGLWSWGGSPNGSQYPLSNGTVSDDFGTNVWTSLGQPAQDLTQYHLYNISSSSTEWTQRFNGLVNYDRVGANTVSFNSLPTLGVSFGGGNFSGDIAEVIVYDHVLSPYERETVGIYLGNKYALFGPPARPDAPASLKASALSATQVSLQWSAPVSSDLVTYLLERSTDGVSFTQVASVANSLSYIDTGLAAATTYTYRIRAQGYAGTSGYSNMPAATTLLDTPDLLVTPQQGMRLWLRADTGMVFDANERVVIWPDQSGNGNNAIPPNQSSEPTLVTAQMDPSVPNGRPVVRFNKSNSQSLKLPTNPMSGASQGEIFAVVRSTGFGGLWSWGGSPNGSQYPLSNGTVSDDFGTNVWTSLGQPAQDLTQYHLYNISSSSTEWTQRFNGLVNYDRVGANTVSFNSLPTLGVSFGGGNFSGDIAEVIVYDHVLSPYERETVGIYLGNKYALFGPPARPDAPASLKASALSATQVSLQWSAPVSSDLVTYLLERSTDGVSFTQVASVANSLSYIDTGLAAATTYTYRIRAQGYAGTSGYSNMPAATTLLDTPDLLVTPQQGMRLWLRADTGMVFDANERVVIWPDQSGNGNNAIPPNQSSEPTLVTAQMDPSVPNGRPVVRFNKSNSQSLKLPTNPMSGASQGEIFAVVRSTGFGGLWSWGGSPNGSQYPLSNGTVSDDFGTNVWTSLGQPAQDLTQYHLYNISSSSTEWTQRFNGLVNYDRVGANTVSFNSLPTLGVSFGGGNFSGDIAEIIVYDHVLDEEERETVGFYLNSKYAIAPPATFDNIRDGNDDGLPDAVDRQLGLDPTSMDVDGDGIPNIVELMNGTDPLSNDTDGDGVPDNLDAYPLDPTRSSPLGPTSGDTTAPTITLTAPAGAVPLD